MPAEPFECVAIGDLHLGKPRLENLYEDAYKLQLVELSRACDWALKRKIKNVVLLGDISDKPSLPDHIELALINLLNKYQKNQNFYLILGNHDKEQKTVHSLSKIEWLAKNVWDNVTVITDVLALGAVEFHAWPNHTPLSKGTVCFGHVERPGSLADNGMTLASGYEQTDDNHWVMGHLHTPHKTGNTRYAGTLYQTSFGETVNKGFVHVVVDPSLPEPKIRPVKHTPQFSLVTLTVNKGESPVLDDNPNTRYRIFYTDELPANFLLDNPRVVECRPIKDKAQLERLLIPDNIEYEVTDGLQELLEEKGLGHKYDLAVSHIQKALKED